MRKLLFGLTVLICFSFSVQAAEVAGVNLPEKITLEGSSEQLQLNGAGIRKKFFFKVYVGSLYLGSKNSDTDKVINQPGAKRVQMNFLYDEVSAEKINGAWADGLADNHSEKQLVALKEPLAKFQSFFGDTVKGDVYLIDYVPGKGTVVSINGQLKGSIPGENFYKALLTIWIGESPITSSLKNAMLGK